MLPAIGKIFERYGPLSMIFYKEGHFKSNFLYFDKKPLLFQKEKNERKNAQNSKML